MVWIPYFLLEFWEPETDGSTIAASEKDTTERQFEVWFFLENPPARKQFVEVRLEGAQMKQQTDGTGRQVVVRFEPDDKGQLKAIAFRVHDDHPKKAMRYCFNSLSKLLSVWAVGYGSGFSIWGVRIVDSKHKAQWKVVPQQGVPEEFGLPAGIEMGEEHATMLSLYREARNSASPFYRFLCSYKILEAWYRNRNVFGQADRIVKDNALPFGRPKRRITNDMLVMSLVFKSRPEFLDVTFNRFFELLAPWRAQVAHALTDEGTFANFDDYQSYIDLGPLANLTDLVARQVMIDEYELWQRILDAGVLPKAQPANGTATELPTDS